MLQLVLIKKTKVQFEIFSFFFEKCLKKCVFPKTKKYKMLYIT